MFYMTKCCLLLTQCKLENSTVVQDKYARICSPSDRITPDLVRQDDFVLQTIIATYMTAQGLSNVDECRDSPLGTYQLS